MIIKKILVALLSAIFFGFLMAVWDPSGLTTKFSWLGVWFFTLYSIPIYVIGGIPMSILIDMVSSLNPFQSPFSAYSLKFGLYGVAGMVAAYIYLMIFAMAENEFYLIPQDLTAYLIYGIIASLIYYHLTLVPLLKKH